MNSIDLSWLLIVEAVLPFLALNIVLVLVIMSGRNKFRLAAKKLIKAVKSNEELEREKLITFQTEKLAIEPKIAKMNAKKIINERKFIVRNLVSGLVDKNVEAISLLDQDISNLTDKYHQLKVGLVIAEPVKEEVPIEEIEQPAPVNDKSKELKKEIKNLKQEVHITLTTLNNIFKEFSSMFGEDDVPDGQMSVDQIITAMESFAGKSSGDTKTDADVDAKTAVDTSAKAVEDIEANAEAEASPKAEIETDSETEIPAKDELQSKPEADAEKEITTQQADEPEVVKSEAVKSEGTPIESPGVEQAQQEETVKNPEAEANTTDSADDLDFSVDAAIDDIDSALDELELDSTDEEPDWGDAFAESGDTMEEDPNKS